MLTDQVLNILKFALLGLIYLFFARVLWAVWSEVRVPRGRAGATSQARAGLPPGRVPYGQPQPGGTPVGPTGTQPQGIRLPACRVTL